MSAEQGDGSRVTTGQLKTKNNKKSQTSKHKQEHFKKCYQMKTPHIGTVMNHLHGIPARGMSCHHPAKLKSWRRNVTHHVHRVLHRCTSSTLSQNVLERIFYLLWLESDWVAAIQTSSFLITRKFNNIVPMRNDCTLDCLKQRVVLGDNTVRGQLSAALLDYLQELMEIWSWFAKISLSVIFFSLSFD